MTQSNLITTCHYQQLSAEERGQIQVLHEDNYSMRVIAVRLHRSPATISREPKRGKVRQLNTDYLPYFRYFADAGQAIYQKHRLNCHAKGLMKR